MTRSLVAVAFLGLLAVGAAFCGRGPARGDARERAYSANNLGVAELEQFNYAGAADAFREALKIDGGLVVARVNLSLALLYAQDLQGAAREAAAAARREPADPQAHYILGLVARAQNRDADAVAEFELVRQGDPNDVGTRINLGQIYLEQQKYAQAIVLLRGAAAAEPFNVTASYNLGLALTRSGQAAEGTPILQRAQALRATGYAVTYGTGYLEQGRYAEAVASTGQEPELVDMTLPRAAFMPVTIGAALSAGAAAASPFGRSYSAADLTSTGMQQIAAGLGGGLTLLDFDNDGDLDLVDASPGGQRLFRNDGQGKWTDVTAASGLERPPSGSVAVGCVAGDYDNDGRTDLFVLRYGVSSLYHNDGGGHFSDVTATAGLPPYPFLAGAAAFVDVDHDGDLDLVVAGLADLDGSRSRATSGALTFPRDFAPAPLRLLRNNGNGAFTDTSADAHLQILTRAVAIVPTDFDNRRDVDLLVVNRTGPPLLFQNLRDGTFRDVAADVGLTAVVRPEDEITGVAAADVNKDSFPDFFFARADGGAFALSDGRGRFTSASLAPGMKPAMASQFVDYDNDGLLDLLTWSTDGPHVFRNLGQRWSDVTDSAIKGASGVATLASSRSLALADLDADGRTDLVTRGAGGLTFWRNGGGPGRSLRIVLKGRVSNRLGLGSKVEARAGALSSRFETSAATPPVAPADIVFGLGNRPGADAVRVLWPSGVLQAEASGSALASPLTVEELNRKPSSCPFLFAWNGQRFEFITDFMGGGEMGYLEKPGEPGGRNVPDPVEYVRIGGNELKARDGKFDLRITNELEETLFADRMQLIAITHRPGVDIYPDEGMTGTPKPFRVFAVTNQRVPGAVDDRGHDVTDRVSQIDRRYVDSFALDRFRGYAAPHTLTLDLAPVGRAPILLLTGWTDYAFSSDNLAAHQAGLALTPPALEVRDEHGRWRTLIADIGIPVGRPQTVTVDLAGRLGPGEHEVRIVTNMRIFWDRVLVATGAPGERLEMHALDPVAATLRARGFSAEIRPDGHEPPRYDYDRVSPRQSPWKTMVGHYTRVGDVRDLLTKADDMFVIAKPGDEIALSFDAAAAGPLPDGWTRTFLLLADGFSKEMDINSGSPDTVAPLPFHAMTAYPYRAPEHYPDTVEHERYEAAFNTRAVVHGVPPLVAVRRQ